MEFGLSIFLCLPIQIMLNSMDLIRLIKLKKINGELNNLTEPQMYFLSFFNGLTNYNNYYVKNDEKLFYLDIKRKKLYCSYYKVFCEFSKFHMTHEQSVLLINDILKNILRVDITMNIRYLGDFSC